MILQWWILYIQLSKVRHKFTHTGKICIWPISVVYFCRIYIASWKYIFLSSDYKGIVIHHLPYSVLFSTFAQKNTTFIVTIPVTEWE